jgi:hypothetical protein
MAKRAVIARTGFFVLYSVFKERHGRDWYRTVLDPLIAGHASDSQAVPLPGGYGHRWLPCGLLASGEGSSERSANLSGVTDPVKPGFRHFRVQEADRRI